MKPQMTKRSLLLSALSLLLCVSMLIGSTFAWFTDSVTSGVNKIQAGNLDIELDYKTVNDGALAAEWTSVESKVDIFNPDALWEPGRVEVVYLKVSNKGTLNLKYQLGVNVNDEIIGETEDNQPIRLSEHLVFKVIDLADEPSVAYTRSEAIAAAGDVKGMNTYSGSTTTLEVDGTDYVALIVYMPETVGNEANYRGDAIPTIHLGISLFATQVEAEKDSFDEYYDKEANHPDFKVTTASDLQNAVNEAQPGDVIVLENDIVLTDGPIVIPAAATAYSLRSSANYVTIDLNGRTLSAVDMNVIRNDGTNVIIENGTVSRSGVNGGYAINNVSGALAVDELTVVGGIYTSGPALSVTDSNVSQYLSYRHGIYTYNCEATIDNSTLHNNNAGSATIMAAGTSVVTVNNSNVTIADGRTTQNWTSCLLDARDSAEIIVNGGCYDGHVRVQTGATITINDATFVNTCTNDKYTIQAGGNLVINGGTLWFDPAGYVADGYKIVEVDGSYLVISADRDYVTDGVLESTDDTTYYITDADGYAWVEAQDDVFFAGKTVKLDASIDFGGETIPAIRFWNPENKTTFDGNGMTLSNFVIENSGNAGLFNGTLTVKNLNVDNAVVTGNYVGVIAGNMYGDIINCTVQNSEINGSYWQTGALAGQYNAGNITECTVENCTINGKAAVGALIGILNESAGERKIENCTVKNCDIIQTGSFGGSYDDMFGVAAGLINIENSTVYVNDCVFEGNTLKGEASDTLFGVIETGTIVVIDGIQQVTTPITDAEPAPFVGESFDEGANVVAYQNMNLTGDAYIAINYNAPTAIENVTADVDGSVIIMEQYNPAVCLQNCEFIIDEGEYLIDASAFEGGVYQIFLINVKVNGEYLTQESAAQYLNNVNWYNAVTG